MMLVLEIKAGRASVPLGSVSAMEPGPHEWLPFAEYQVDAQPLRPCELQRERAFLKRADYVPQCAEDGSFQ